jgi:O-antigen ligase
MNISSSIFKDRKKLIEVLFFIFTVASIVTLPFSMRANSMAIFTLAFIWLIQNNFSRLLQTLKSNKLFYLFISFYGLTALSMLYTQNKTAGRFELEKEFSILLFPILMASSKAFTKRKIHLLLWMFILSNFLIGVIGLLYATYSHIRYGMNYFFYHDLLILFNFHATYYSIYLMFSICAIIYLYMNDPFVSGRLKKYALFMVSAFFIVLIFLLSIRFIIVFFCFSALVCIVIFAIKKRSILLGILLIAGFAGLVYFGISKNEVLKARLMQIKENHKYEFSEFNIYNGFTTRLAQWECSYLIIQRQPVLGVGIGDTQDELQVEYKKNFLHYSFKDKFNAHNQYFQTCLGLGVVGLTLFVLMLFVPLVIAFRKRNFLYACFIIFFAAVCLTESALCTQYGLVFYTFFNSFFAFKMLENKGGVPDANERTRS